MKNSLIITGYSGSGKTTLTNYLEKEGWKVISAGQCFTKIALSHGIKNSRSLIQEFSVKYFKKYGYKTFSNLLLNEVNGYKNVIFEGVRPIEVVKEIKNRYSHTKIIFLDSDIFLREQRIISRSKFSKKKVLSIQNHSIEQNLLLVKNEADYIIKNNTTIQSLINEFHSCINS